MSKLLYRQILEFNDIHGSFFQCWFPFQIPLMIGEIIDLRVSTDSLAVTGYKNKPELRKQWRVEHVVYETFQPFQQINHQLNFLPTKRIVLREVPCEELVE